MLAGGESAVNVGQGDVKPADWQALRHAAFWAPARGLHELPAKLQKVLQLVSCDVYTVRACFLLLLGDTAQAQACSKSGALFSPLI